MILKSRPPRLNDTGMETPWSTWVLQTSRSGVSLVTPIMRSKTKECRSRKQNGKFRGYLVLTNPLKTKNKANTTSKASDTNHLPTVKVDKKLDFVKSCTKKYEFGGRPSQHQ